MVILSPPPSLPLGALVDNGGIGSIGAIGKDGREGNI